MPAHRTARASWTRSTTAWTLSLVATALVLAGCGDDGDAATDAPDGYAVVEHPDAQVALPEDWTPISESSLAEADPDVVHLVYPEAPEGVELGGALWRYSEPVGRAEDAATLLATQVQLSTGMEQTRSESVEIAGSDGGFVIQLRGESALDGEEVVFTYVSALYGDRSMVLRLAGTEDHVSPQTVQTAIDTFRVVTNG